ncbi:MAG: penicillin-binding transpeptidase domain-containing protein [Lawsonella clevelandensis]
MKPYLVEAETAQDLSVLYEAKPKELQPGHLQKVAKQLTKLMITAEQYAGGANTLTVPVASKTGTAEHGTDSKNSIPYTWYIAFVPGHDVAVAVMIEGGAGVNARFRGRHRRRPRRRAPSSRPPSASPPRSPSLPRTATPATRTLPATSHPHLHRHRHPQLPGQRQRR